MTTSFKPAILKLWAPKKCIQNWVWMTGSFCQAWMVQLWASPIVHQNYCMALMTPSLVDRGGARRAQTVKGGGITHQTCLLEVWNERNARVFNNASRFPDHHLQYAK
jgi:hypothetical protein